MSGVPGVTRQSALSALIAMLDPGHDPEIASELDPVGAEKAGRAVLQTLFDRCTPLSGTVGELLERIGELHRDEGANGISKGGEWQALRAQSVALVDRTQGEQQALARVAEASAWSMHGSTSLLTEVFAAVAAVLRERKAGVLGWTAADQAEAFARLGVIHAELANEGEPVDRSRIPGIFAVRHPELEQRFVQQLEATNAAHLAFLRETLGQARAAATRCGAGASD